MKEHFLREIVYQIKSRPNLKKKIKFFLLVSVAGVIVTTALLVWAAFSFLGHVNTKLQSANLKDTVQSLQTNTQQLTQINLVSCWGQAQNMINVETWMTKPVAENLQILKSACWQNTVSPCEGLDCNQKKNPPEAKDWRT